MIYDDLGLAPVVNANATLTALGGSLMPRPVVDAMAEAAAAFVDMFELQRAVSARLAALTRNESALVVTGASAGLLVGALGMMTGADHRKLGTLLEHGARALPRHEIIMHRAHRIPYDNVLTLAGAGVVEIGNAIQTFPWELEAAIGERTAGILYVAGEHLARAALPLPEVAAIAGEHGVPVLVDAAAQLPPRENLWRFTEQGAALAVFSGGKELRGPQSSGLVVGTAEAVAACELHAAPHQRFGRPAKVGKEEMVGLLAAVEWWMERDLDADAKRIERATRRWIDELGSLPGLTVTRDFPSEAGRPLPRALVSWGPGLGLTGADCARLLRAGDPPIDVAVAGERAVWLNAELLTAEEEAVVSARTAAVLGPRGSAST